MAYYQHVLQDDEHLLIACRQHWIVFGGAITLVAIAFILFLVADGFANAPLLRLLLDYSGDLGLLLAAINFVTALISWLSTEIAVTDRRILYKRGLFSRRTIEMNISKVETVDVEQGPLGMLLNFGDVIVRGTGGSFEPLRHVAAPLPLRNAILVG